MESALAWIGKLFEFFGSLFPRLLVIEATHAGVAFIRGKKVKTLGPGLHVYWPFWTNVMTSATVRQTVNLPSQALVTSDGQCVLVGGMVRYELSDIQAALAESWDIDGIIVDESMAVICQYITSADFSTVQADRKRVNTELTRRVRQGLEGYGVNVLRAQLTDFAKAVMLLHAGHVLNKTGQE